MNIITKIFRKIWGVWHALWFVITIIIFAPVHIILAPIFGEKAARFLIFMTYRFAAYFIIIPPLNWVKNHGREKIDKKRSYMVVANHSSNLDFYVHPYSTPVDVRVLVKRELEKIPLFGSVMKAIAVSVERGNRESGKSGLAKLREKLALGYSILIYPEGTRNKSDELLGKFKNGAFRMAIECELPIIVSTIGNARQINDLRNGIFDCRPGFIHVYWSDIIETKGMTMDDIPKLSEMCREIMTQNILKHEV